MPTDLHVERLVVGPLLTNCYIIWDEHSGEGAIIDPGEDPGAILSRIADLGIEVRCYIATHCHFDHIAAIAPLKRRIGAEFLIHEGDISFVEDAKNAAQRWGFEIEQPPMPDRYMSEGEIIRIGGGALRVIHTPGHSPGGVSLYEEGRVFAGDCLFQGGIGRTDFRMGSFDILAKSIRTRLYTLPDDTAVYPGHGACTTIGNERRHNPFVRG
ncbi:MAG: MBL fold metallo-hydrolase [Candidatus Thermoplasmatota archaeon]